MRFVVVQCAFVRVEPVYVDFALSSRDSWEMGGKLEVRWKSCVTLTLLQGRVDLFLSR